jgi:hypothetical protein
VRLGIATFLVFFSHVARGNDEAGSPNQTVDVLLLSQEACCSEQAWPAVETRIQKELRLSDVNVTVVKAEDSRTDSVRTRLENALQATTARGAMLVTVAEEGAASLHLLLPADTPAHRNMYISIVLSGAPTADAVEIAAMKAREATLASLYQLDGKSTTANVPDLASVKAPVPSSEDIPETKVMPARDNRRLASGAVVLSTRLGALWAPGGLGVMGTVGIAFSWHLRKVISFGGSAWMSVLSKDIESRLATASVRLISGRLHCAYQFRPPGVVVPEVGIHAGVLYFQSRGESATVPVRQSRAVLFFAGAFARFRFRISKRLAIPIMLGVGAVPPGVRVRFDGTPRASLKVLLLEASVGFSFIF